MKNELAEKQLQRSSYSFKIERNEILEELNKSSCPLSEKEKSKLVQYLIMTNRKKEFQLTALRDL